MPFLMPVPTTRLTAALRHMALRMFCVVTYAFTRIAGLGWCLRVTALARAEPMDACLERLYVATFIGVLLLTELP